MGRQISYRRKLLDDLLIENSSKMHGIVVDVGGEQKNQRGYFNWLELEKSSSWYSMNISPDAAPHVYGDAHLLPFSSSSVDCVLCCEVLEHIKDPRQGCNEIWRVLKPGGVVFISVPFLLPIHADPDDYQRFTPSGIKILLNDFDLINIIPMGGSIGTLGGLIVNIGNTLEHNPLVRKLVKLVGRIMIWIETRFGSSMVQGPISTGYFVEASKL